MFSDNVSYATGNASRVYVPTVITRRQHRTGPESDDYNCLLEPVSQAGMMFTLRLTLSNNRNSKWKTAHYDKVIFKVYIQLLYPQNDAHTEMIK